MHEYMEFESLVFLSITMLSFPKIYDTFLIIRIQPSFSEL